MPFFFVLQRTPFVLMSPNMGLSVHWMWIMSVCQIKSVLLDENVVQRHMIMKPANSYVWYPYRKVRGIYNRFSIKPEFLVTVNPSSESAN